MIHITSAVIDIWAKTSFLDRFFNAIGNLLYTRHWYCLTYVEATYPDDTIHGTLQFVLHTFDSLIAVYIMMTAALAMCAGSIVLQRYVTADLKPPTVPQELVTMPFVLIVLLENQHE